MFFPFKILKKKIKIKITFLNIISKKKKKKNFFSCISKNYGFINFNQNFRTS